MQSSLRAIAYRLGTGNSVDLRGCEYNRGTGCGKTARQGLCGGRRVTGAPTVRAKIISLHLVIQWITFNAC